MANTIRELAKENPMMHSFDYKWKDSKNFRFLEDVLNELGYTFKHQIDCNEQTDYNDLKAYYNVEIVPL